MLVLYLSHSLLTCPAPAQVALCWYYVSRTVYSHAPHQLRWLCAGTISLAQSTHMPRTSSGGFVLVLYLSHSLLTCPAPAQVALCLYYIPHKVCLHGEEQVHVWLSATSSALHILSSRLCINLPGHCGSMECCVAVECGICRG